MRRGSLGAWGLVLLVLMSACMSGRAAPRGHSITVVPTTFARPTETVLHEGPGELVGRVLDDEVRPLADALVEVFRRKMDLVFQLSLRTDTVGQFVVRGMAAGEYVIYVSKQGYLPHKPEIVYVEDGKTTRADWLLPPGPARDPFHVSKPYVWSVNAAACPLVLGQPITGTCVEGGNTHPFMVDEVNNTLLMTLFVESRWQGSFGLCPGAVRNDVFSPQQAGFTGDAARSPSNPFHWDNLPGVTSPSALMIPREGDTPAAMMNKERTAHNGGANITTHGQWTVVASAFPKATAGLPADYSCMVLVTVTTALTFFHGTPAPGANWTYFK